MEVRCENKLDLGGLSDGSIIIALETSLFPCLIDVMGAICVHEVVEGYVEALSAVSPNNGFIDVGQRVEEVCVEVHLNQNGWPKRLGPLSGL